WAQRSLLRYRQTCLQIEFNRALNSRPVANIQFIRFDRVQATQDLMKMFAPVSLSDVRETCAQVFVSCGARKERLTQRPEIKASTSYEKSSAATALDLFDFLQSLAGPISSSEIDQWRNEID